MWTLSGFADEIDPDLEDPVPAAEPNSASRYLEFRSAWDVNVLDLSDEQLDEAEKILAATIRSRSRPSARRSARSTSTTTSTHTCVRMRPGAVRCAAASSAPYIRIFSFFLRPDQSPPTTATR